MEKNSHNFLNNIDITRKILFLFLILNGISFCYASCESGDIDINTASLTELDKLSGIGPVKAQAIIDSRPFSSVDDLLNANGIGEITLEKIKSQGLACVSSENSENENDANDNREEVSDTNDNEKDNNEKIIEENDEKEIITEAKEVITGSTVQEISSSNLNKVEQKIDTINLNPKDIKTSENNENLTDNRYTIYGLVIFCILLGLLFLLKRDKYKNEFE